MLEWFSNFMWQSIHQFSYSVMSDSLQPHEPQHTRPPCLSPTPRAYQTHVHWVSDAIQPSHSRLSSSPPALNLSQHQSIFQWVSSSHQVAKMTIKITLITQSLQGGSNVSLENTKELPFLRNSGSVSRQNTLEKDIYKDVHCYGIWI